ncbi:DUF1127 domain-containing protein [Endozoicomonas arenosclerae]|uniref:DUF1127 domain-containing protein n=1 Tax=Endozoicomonas arenosclerae TaxID=1633495 RepID=UPI000783FABB|nr:DUF1127 domain-containing protein [Endozoicomonas arenosclerae]
MKQSSYWKIADLPIYLINLWETWRNRSRSRRYLARMDSRMLKDIGVTEADRIDEASKPFWKQ